MVRRTILSPQRQEAGHQVGHWEAHWADDLACTLTLKNNGFDFDNTMSRNAAKTAEYDSCTSQREIGGFWV